MFHYKTLDYRRFFKVKQKSQEFLGKTFLYAESSRINSSILGIFSKQKFLYYGNFPGKYFKIWSFDENKIDSRKFSQKKR